MYKSEIRKSTINDLCEKVKTRNYGEYLLKVSIQKIRGFEEKDINFEFPVTALIGPNGSGKSSILGAAACAYKMIKPSVFFPKSSIGDTSMAEWRMAYELIDKQIQPKNIIKRTANFRQARWNREGLDRTVLFFGIERTVPAGEKTVFKRLTTSSYHHQEEIKNIEQNVAINVRKILGKDVSNYQITNYGDNNKFLIGENRGTTFSEFHFGAGESSIIRMVEKIENAPDNSLILIEEIENGLHPVAVAKMVEYLIDVASRKSIQTIFTSHSDYSLLPLPSEAIWACINGDLQQGKLSVESLRAVSGRVDKALAIFVEDDFAKVWVEAILRKHLFHRYEQIEVHAVQGDGNAVKIHQANLKNPAFPAKSLCILDGDSSQPISKDIIKLPGEQPEQTIFDNVLSRISQDIAKLTVAFHLGIELQNNVKRTLERIRNTNRDPHLLFVQIGSELGLISEEIIKSAFITNWIDNNIDECKRICDYINNMFSRTNE